MKVPKLNLDKINRLTKQELQAIILLYYYDWLQLHAEQDTELWQKEMSRRFIEAKLDDYNGVIGTIVYSVAGSPPKGTALLQADNFNHNELTGRLFLFGVAGKVSRPYQVCIVDDTLRTNPIGSKPVLEATK